MTRTKLAGLLSTMVLLVLIGERAAGQSLNWVHHATGVTTPDSDIAIGFTGPWVNVFYEWDTGQSTEIRGIRQFPVANPTNNTQYVPYPDVLTTFPSNVTVKVRADAGPADWRYDRVLARIGVLARTNDAQSPSQLLLISGVEPPPPAPIPGVEAFAFRPNGELVTFQVSDLVGVTTPDRLVAAGATDLDVALVDFELVNPQNQIYEINYRQTAFGTGVFLPPDVVASVPGLNPDSIDFTMTASGIPHVVFSHPGTSQIIARQFDTKVNAWTTSILDTVAGVLPEDAIVSLAAGMVRGSYMLDDLVVAATWATANPNNPNAPKFDLRVAIKKGDGDWQVSTVCTACAGNPEQLDITISPDGYPVIAFVTPTNQLMVAYDPLLPQPVDGDYNGDGSVDAADYVLWRKTDGTQAGYDHWRGNFGRSVASGSGAVAGPASSASVPEPRLIMMLFMAAPMSWWRRRQIVT